MSAKQIFQLCIVLLYGFAMGLSEFVIIGIEPELATSYGITLDQVGLSISLFAAAYAICTPILAFTTGRFKRYTLVLAYGLIMTLGTLLGMLAPNYELLLASRIIIGAVSGGMLALCITFVPELMPEKLIPIGISMVYSSYSIAMVIVTSVGRIAAITIGWKAMMAVVFVGMLVISIAAAVFLPRTGNTDAPATAREQLVLIQQPRVIVGMLTFVFGVAAVYVFYGYITPYLETVLGLEPHQTAFALIIFGIMSFVSNMMAGFMDMKWGYRSLIGNFAFLALGLTGMWACGTITIGGIAFVMLTALFMYSLATPIVTMFMDQAKQHCPKGMTLAASLDPMTFNTGIVLGTHAGGMVVMGPGIQHVGLVGALFALGALGLVFLNLRLASAK